VSLKADGSLNLDWRERRRRDPRAPLTAEDLEEMREEIIAWLMRDKQLTREEAEQLLEGFL
jgi:hypothetical protein